MDKIALVIAVEGEAEAIQNIAKIDSQLKELRQEIKNVADGNNEAKKALAGVDAELDSLAKNGKKGTDTYKELAARSKELNEEIEKNNEILGKAAVTERAFREERKQTNKEINQSIRDFNKFQKAIPNDSIEGMARRYSDLRKELRLVPKQIRDQAKEFGNNEKALEKLDPAIRQAIVRYREMQEEALATKKEIMSFDGEINDFTSNIGNYRSALEGLNLGGIFGKGGSAALGVADAFTGGGLSGLGGLGSTIGEITTLLGPTGSLVAGVAAGSLAIADYVADVTLEYEKLFNSVGRATGAQGQDIVEVTTRIKTLSEVLDQDFDRILQAVNNTQRAFGEDFTTTLDAIQNGLLSFGSSEAQDEFLDSLREYPQLIENTGISLEEFVALNLEQERQGFYTDKLIDSVKEAGIALGEFTQTQRDAITNTLGQEFSDSIEARIRNQEVTVKDAILEIGQALEESGADQQDYALITADVFKAAGEDVGGFQKVYESLQNAITDANDGLEVSYTAFSERQAFLIESTQQLNEEQATLAAQFAGVGVSMEGLGTRAKALGTSLLNDVLLGFRAVGKEFTDGGFVRGLKASLDLVATGGDFGLNAVIEEVKAADAEALAVQTETEERAEEQERSAEERAAEAEKRAERAAKKAADRNKELAKEREAEQKKAEQEAKRIEREQERAEAAEAKAAEERQKRREKAAQNIEKIEREIGAAQATAAEKTLADLEEFDRQASNLRGDADTAIGSLVGDPEQIAEQTRLIEQRLSQQIEVLRQKRQEAITAGQNETTSNQLGAVDQNTALDTLGAFNAFNTATATDPSLEAREEAEKKLQERLLEIQLEGLEERREIIENAEGLTEEERTAKLLEFAELEKQINLEKNKEIIEQEEDAAKKREEFLKQLADANERAFNQIGEALGEFFVNQAGDVEDAFGRLANSLKDIILDLIEQQLILLATTAFSQPDSVASFGASGAIRIALITGLIKGSIGALKSLFTFEQGGQISDMIQQSTSSISRRGKRFPAKTGGKIIGPDHTQGGVPFRISGTDIVGEARGDEIIMNREQQEAGARIFGGDFLERIDSNVFDVVGYTPNFGGESTGATVKAKTTISTKQMQEFAQETGHVFRQALLNMKQDIIDGVMIGLEEDKKKKAAKARSKKNSRI